MREHARLAAPGACQDEERPVPVRHGGELLRIQYFRERVHANFPVTRQTAVGGR